MSDVGAIIKRLAAELLPGWSVTWEECHSADIGGALAMVYPTPARQLAHVKIAPHPPGESVAESIAHELTHAMISPLVALVECTPAAVMIEEQIVERLGVKLAKLGNGLARAVSRALTNPRTNSLAVRARISALANGRRLGKGRQRMMTAEQAQKALEALESGDAEAAKGILKEIIAAMVAGAHAEPDGDEGAPMREEEEQEPMQRDDMNGNGGGYRGGSEEQRGAMRGGKARKGSQVNPWEARQRQAVASMTRDAIRMRIHTARMVDNFQLPAALETKILACTSLERAEELLDVARIARAEANGGTQRARSGAEAGSSPNTTDGPGLDVEALVKEGFPRSLALDLAAQHKIDPMGADVQIKSARARLGNVVDIEAQRARQNGGR